MFELYGEKTVKSVQQSGMRFRSRLPDDMVGDTYRAARAIQTEDEITQEYDASELLAICSETEPPRGES